MFSFGAKSKAQLKTAHKDLQEIMNRAIRMSDVDFGIAEGHRTIEKQQQYFAEGKSKLDGVNNKSKHNYDPSLAVDIYAYVNHKASWDKEHLSYLAGMIHAVAEMLFEQEIITHKLRWGGNWDGDGIILDDQSFDDLPHFELVSQ